MLHVVLSFSSYILSELHYLVTLVMALPLSVPVSHAFEPECSGSLWTSLMVLITPVLFLLWHVKMSAVNKAKDQAAAAAHTAPPLHETSSSHLCFFAFSGLHEFSPA